MNSSLKEANPKKNEMMSKDIRTYVASAIFVFMLILLLAYLTFIPVPDENKDLIVTIIGVLVGGSASAMANLFGASDEEKEKLIIRINSLDKKYRVLQAEYETLDRKYTKMTEMLIRRHIVPKDGIE